MYKRLTPIFASCILFSCAFFSSQIDVTGEPLSATRSTRSVTPTRYPTSVRSTAVAIKTATSTAKLAIQPSPSTTEWGSDIESAPEAELSADGPYIAFFLDGEGRQHPSLLLLGAEGVGRKEYPLPMGAHMGSCVPCNLSPDGVWASFWTGSGIVDFDRAKEDPPVLHLLNLKDGSTLRVAALLSEDYPGNFDILDEYLKKNNPEEYPIARMEFWDGLFSAAWSPDGRTLAFAGQIDGPSSDLYTYNIATQKIVRLTDGMGNIYPQNAIEWSPDGRWLLHSGIFSMEMGTEIRYYAAATDGSAVKELPKTSGGTKQRWNSTTWLSANVFLMYSSANGPGLYRITSVNIQTGQASVLWSSAFYSFAFSPQSGMLAVAGGMPWPEETSGGDGFYFFPTHGGAQKRLMDLQGGQVVYVGNQQIEFLLLADVGESGHEDYVVYAITPDGEAVRLMNGWYTPMVSPDKQWILLYGETTVLVGPDLAIATLDSLHDVGNLYWQPDSGGFYFTTGTGLFFYHRTTGGILRIPHVLNREISGEAVWIG